MSESSYYLSEQAADLVRSGAMAVVHLTEQRKSLSGKQLVSLVLKRSANWTPTPGPPSRPSVCHQFPPLPSGSPPALVWTAIAHRCPLWAVPLWWPRLLVREELPGRQSEDRPLMRTPSLASTSDMQRRPLMKQGLTCTHLSTHTLTRASSILRWRDEEDDD